jgi:hypothetical protein
MGRLGIGKRLGTVHGTTCRALAESGQQRGCVIGLCQSTRRQWGDRDRRDQQKPKDFQSALHQHFIPIY